VVGQASPLPVNVARTSAIATSQSVPLRGVEASEEDRSLPRSSVVSLRPSLLPKRPTAESRKST
jgi:hypothetical protein